MDRDKFEALVKQKSPLSLQQFEALFGRVDESNKSLAWKLLQISTEGQRLVGLIKLGFPRAIIENIN